MKRYLRYLALALALTYTAPVFAQMSFEGLDLSGDTASRKKRKKKRRTHSTPARSDKSDQDKEEGDDEESASSGTDLPLPTGGLDLRDDASTGAADVGTPTIEKSVKPPETKTAPTMSFEAVDVSGKSGEQQRLSAAQDLFRAEKYDQAALAAWDLMQDPKMAALQVDAHYLLAKSLYRMGLYHSSLVEFTRILERGPTTKYFNTSLEWLFYVSRKTVNESVVLETIARYSNFEFPERFRNEFRYLLSRYHFVRGRALDQVGQKEEADKSFAEVKRVALQIPESDPFYPRARYLEALALYRDGNFSGALESLKQVVRLTRTAVNHGADPKVMKQLRELAFMQLARIHYEHRQNRNAIFYLSKIERGTSQWLEALFESAWANYRVGQYEQALGNLITLSSPFFRDEYFPESMILKAVIYYENCRYRESTMIIEDFERLYGPVRDELDQLIARDMDASEYYTILSEVQKKNASASEKNPTDLILERVLRLALTDKDLKKTNDSILELEAEMASFENQSDAFRYSSLVKSLEEELKVQRTNLIKKAGIMAKGKLQYELGQLNDLLGKGLRIKFETTEKEKEFLEEQLQSGGKKEIVKNYKYSVAVSDTELYWPYEGEYWRDELGTYQYTLTKGCIERAGRVGDDEGSGGR
ncbi:MAG: adventurous gliding motility protein GltC [Myxococcaceae bacterium]|nr:adventurous gliding motility protein GltC [Myxococcaceae bacterium]